MKAGEEAKKGLFLSLSWLAIFVLILVLALLFFLVYPRLFQIHNVFPYIFLALELLILIVVGGGLILITLSALLEKDFLYPHGKKQITIRVLFPIVVFFGRLFGISKDKLRSSYVDVNDALIKATKKRISTDKILLLLPHCLQNSECPWRITFDIHNCRNCGNCVISELLEIVDKYKISMKVATGGTIARKVIKEIRPTVIIAVACQRDLTSGITDAYPIPVYGILNKRPNGPCFNTDVDIDKVKEALDFLLNKND
ncbi:DUF116 domain-containing protein [bacterium]|nr:DUF116 domain-containing protein [bacterium]